MKPYLACLAAVLVLVTANTARAESGGRWWRNPRLVERLHLTPSQTERLDKAFHQARLNMIRLKSKMEAAQFELESLMEAEDFDEAAAVAQYRKLEQARTELGMERFRFLVQVRKIVGHEAFQELMQIKRTRQKRRVRAGQGP